VNEGRYQAFAGTCAVLTGVAGLLYAVAFVVIAPATGRAGGFLSALFLMTGGLLAIPVLIALYERLRPQAGPPALWALLVGVLGATGAVIHGGYDLANVLHPPAAAATDFPSQIDPRGLLTFGFAGLAVGIFAWLIGRDPDLPRGLSSLGYLSAVLLLLIYLARLTIVTASNPLVLGPAALEGFIVNPAWYIWLGLVLRRGALRL
jgi:hypothetical protein